MNKRQLSWTRKYNNNPFIIASRAYFQHFSLSILLWWIEFFSLRFRCYRIEYFYGFENTWYMFWHSTRGFSRWHWGSLCIGVDARSCLCFSGRNLGALFEVLCVGLNIMNLNLLWCYFSTNSWLDRSERISSCYFSTNSRIDRSERIALRWFRTLQTIPSYVLR